MPPPVPRCSSWAYSSLISPSYFSLPRYGSRVGLHIDLFEACPAFTRVAACTLALSPIRDTLIEGFSHFVSSMTAPIASGWSGCRVGLAPTGKRRLCTAHAKSSRLLTDKVSEKALSVRGLTPCVSLPDQSADRLHFCSKAHQFTNPFMPNLPSSDLKVRFARVSVMPQCKSASAPEGYSTAIN
jgi:hypothetical protein